MSVTDEWYNSPLSGKNYNSMNIFDGEDSDIFEINFSGGYLSQGHVKAYSYDPKDETGSVELLTLTFLSKSRVRTSKVIAVGLKVVIYRDTPKAVPMVNFVDGAPQTAGNLDRNAMQAIFAAAEMVDRFESTTGTVTGIGDAVADFSKQVADIQSVSDRVVGQVTSSKFETASAVHTLTLGNLSAERVGLTQGNTTLRFRVQDLVGSVARLTLILRQNTGTNKVTWPSGMKWPNGSAPPLSWTQGAEDVFEIMTYDGGATWYGMYVGGWY
ncbi:tail fiber protein [Vibrio phage vB_VpaP_G1]|uniref:Tail fiber protein n=1 Tax=Vibrio phage vB_VpaP_G1 TaxID=2862773 RepID=A0AAE7WU24_9CAUD|nr:tail fiber protein [Vibrio phage vB_VpaP_G1]QYW05822.1 tail fiber protein [Vibrio phage vB_VpaP_G1]